MLQKNWQTGDQKIAVESVPPKKSSLSPLSLAIMEFQLCCYSLLLPSAAHTRSVFSARKKLPKTSVVIRSKQTPPTRHCCRDTKAEMVKITGGAFQMGRDDGRENEKPAHEVTVGDFWMDKTK
jgi:formylglycine-generating enzyme required for sulfatase activity